LAYRGMELARAGEDNESLRHLLSLAATVANLRGEYEKANEYLEEAAKLAPAKEAEIQEDTPRGGRLIVAIANPAKASEPVNMELVEEAEILTNVFETLLETDHEGNLVPALCEKWEVINEGRSFLLTLRDQVGFQDGHLLTAEDVKRSFEQAIRRASHELPAALAAIQGVSEFASGQANDLTGVIVHSGTRLEIQLSEPLSIYPALLADYKTGITRATNGGEKTDSLPIGTGPFRLALHEPGRIVLERSDNYWKGTPAPLEEIEFRLGLSASAIASGLLAGDFDLARDLSPEHLEELLREPRFRGGLVEAPRKNTYFVMFNSRTGPMAQHLLIRRALSGIVRTHDLVWRTLGRFAQPAACLIPPGLLGHDPGKRRQTLTREEALELLREARVTLPIRLNASVHPLLQDRYGSLLTTLFSIWSELGVEVQNVTSTMAAYLESDQHNEGLDLRVGRWNADYDDPDNFTHSLFHSRLGLYRNYISLEEGDQILEEARAESRPGVRASLYRRYENLLLEFGLILPLFHDIDHRLANQKVCALKLRSNAPYVNYSELGKRETAASSMETPRTSSGTIKVPIAGVITSLDPSLSTTMEQGETLPNIFETLTRDVGGARIVPWLAAEFKVEEGGKRYRFHLREDIRFHDGRRLTARDVRYSFERLLQKPESTARSFYLPIRGAKALINGEAGDLAGFRIHSAGEFTIELVEPISFFPALLSYHVAGIIPEGSNEFEASWDEGCVGTGPFRVVKFDSGRRLELERNKSYWRKGYPRSEELIFSFGVSPEDILSDFRGGRFSLASDLLPADVDALRRDPEFASGYRETPRLMTYYAAFNTHRGALSDRRLRRTLTRTVDVESLVRQTLGRLAFPAHGLIPPGLLGHDPASTSRASASLSTAPPLSAEIELTAALNPVFFGEYTALVRELERAFRVQRVKIKTVNKTIDEWFEAAKGATVDLVVGRWGADYPDADTFAYILHSRDGILGPLCGSPEVDRLIERGRAETSPTVRHSLYRQIEEIIARDTLLLPLFHEQTYRFARPEVEGLSLTYGVTAVDYASLRVRG
jgi:oligopeptide transport system substrate-binding protein